MLIGPPDLSSTVERFSFPIVVRDYAADTATDEFLIAAGSTTDNATIGHVFPAKGADIARLELQSPGAVVEVHTPYKDMRVAVQGSQLRGSVVVWNGREYEVQALGDWWSGPDGQSGYQQAWAQEVTR